MQKLFLTLSSTFLMAGVALAEGPEIQPGELVQSVSPNKVWTAAQINDGSVVIRNHSTGEAWPYFTDMGSRNYFISSGAAASDIGVIAGSTTTSNAAYWEKGRWNVLPTPHPDFISIAYGLSSDGRIICGGAGAAEMANDTEVTMLVPVLWYRGEDGKYGDPVYLPHPEFDITGRKPQYITAIAVSNDGKTVAGQMMDYYGARCEPIVYRCDDKGEWSYTLLGRELLNPYDIEFPEWPGGLADDILRPTQEDYMTPEQLNAFMEAFEAWNGPTDPPLYEDFMTPEKIEEYQKDLKAYLDIMLPWSEKFEYFQSVYREYLSASSSFVFNNVRLSPDGKKYVTTANVVYKNNRGYNPVIFDLDTDEFTILSSQQGVTVNYVADDYTILAFSGAMGADGGSYRAYVFPQMKPGGMWLEDYVKEKNPALLEWMERTLIQDVIVGLNADQSYMTREVFCTGIPTATPDLSLIVTNNSTASWYDSPGDEYITAYLPMTWQSGVETIETDNIADMKLLPGGIIDLGGEFSSLDIYDITGARVYTASDVSGQVNPRLPKGIYIIRATDRSGSSHTLKVSL